jgi:hypothetical protein
LPQSEIILYQTEDGRTRVQCRFEHETLWLTQAQIAELFQTTPQNVTLHLKAIFAEGELVESATCKDYLQVRLEGGREVSRKLRHYRLEAILAVGFRVRSHRGTQFWDPAKPLVLWLLMNPSVACLDFSDPTLRKTGKFSRAWGYGGQLVGNVHAYRATDKHRLLEVADPVGPENDGAILAMAAAAKTVVLAYGQPPKALRDRGRTLTERLRSQGWHADAPALPAGDTAAEGAPTKAMS